MTKKNDTKGDRKHLKLVDKNEPVSEVVLLDTVNEKYESMSDVLNEMYFDDWDGYLEEDMKRKDFVRTVIEMDEMGELHPFIAFDSSFAPTAKKPEFTPEKYEILDLVKLSAEDEDTLLWGLEAMDKEYRIVFIPERAYAKLEQQLRDIIKYISEEKASAEDKEFYPLAFISYIRESTILVNNSLVEFGLLDGDDVDDDDDDAADEPDDVWSSFGFSSEDKEMVFARVDEEIKNIRFSYVGGGDYQVAVAVGP